MFEFLNNWKTENKLYFIIFLFVLMLSVMDIIGIPLWPEASGTYGSFFWTWATIITVLIGIVWFLATGDKSEAIAISAGTKVATLFGGEDVLFYLIKDRTFDMNNMIHLFSHPVMGRIAQFMSLETVTKTSLFVSLIIGGTIIYFGVRHLVKNY